VSTWTSVFLQVSPWKKVHRRYIGDRGGHTNSNRRPTPLPGYVELTTNGHFINRALELRCAETTNSATQLAHHSTSSSSPERKVSRKSRYRWAVTFSVAYRRTVRLQHGAGRCLTLWFRGLRERHRACKKSVLGRTFGTKRVEETRGLRKLPNNELHNLHFILIQPPIQWVPGGKAAKAWTWPLTSNYCRGQENADLYNHSPIHLHGVVLN
jgi:hypothetical protein